MNMRGVTYTTKLGLDNWTKDAWIRIEFQFPRDVMALSHVGSDDPRLTLYYVNATRWRMVDFLGLTPIECARKINLDTRYRNDYYLGILIQAFEGKAWVYRKEQVTQDE